VIEGNKILAELHNSSYKITEIFSITPHSLPFDEKIITKISDRELKKISFLQHPKDSIALCEIPENQEIETDINLILDDIQDPGNFGTMIRLADWFGIEQIICSENTVDLYNPKVIQATMGSFARVNIIYKNLEVFLKNSQNPVLGADMNGKNLYEYHFPKKFNLIFGNEGNGIGSNIEKLLTEKISIPRFGKIQSTESLNVSMAAGIILGKIFSGK
jgi:TrmH family RNA methyltransferase